ncbi:chorion peroxidase [Caerostris extrusa]|uniref:Chorion peroxidase n=1 Tax=Caerostris extrusa TaxID=172846 RepID=A0AAV4UKF5_CAEEX|nr:chorion peroxidase [Caerostris extrusa]
MVLVGLTSVVASLKVEEFQKNYKIAINERQKRSPKEDCSNSYNDCDPDSPYRPIDGTCNNLQYPTWGSAGECFLRFLSPSYSGYGDYRRSVKGGSLPEVRQVCLNIFRKKPSNQEAERASLLMTIYGQTVAHDMSQAIQEEVNIKCCEPEIYNKHCHPIKVKSDDPFFSKYNITCLDFHRSVECKACQTRNREQINMETAPLDSSIVYGSDDVRAKNVRANDGTGRLKADYTGQGELLPGGKLPSDGFCPEFHDSICFKAGDSRVNQHTTLSIFHMLFMREHNRLAFSLKKLNPHWEEERLYQEARRINIAQRQCEIYKEYLPVLLGPYNMNRFDLTLKNGPEGSKYNPTLRMGTWSEFTIAVYRLHSMVAKKIGFTSREFKNLYANPTLIRTGQTNNLLIGVSQVPSASYDHYYADDLTNYLYNWIGLKMIFGASNHYGASIVEESFNINPTMLAPSFLFIVILVASVTNWRTETRVPYGSDLCAVDMQRGRDHGLPAYVYLVSFCSEGQVNITSFDDLAPLVMTPESVDLLRQNYK